MNRGITFKRTTWLTSLLEQNTVSKLHCRQCLTVSSERRPILDGNLRKQELGSTVRITFDSLTLSLDEKRHFSNLEEVDPTVKIEYVAKHNKNSPMFYD